VETNRAELVDTIERLFRQLTWQGRQQFTRRLDAFGLTMPQYAVLYMIRELGPAAKMGEVSESIQLPASSMTSITDRLVRQGLVERGTLPEDRRAVVAALTASGRALVERIEAARHLDLVAMLEGVTDGDLGQFAILLERLLEGVERVLTEQTTESAAGGPVRAS
jgi:DNA-binding MarR family transcriptional regulator